MSPQRRISLLPRPQHVYVPPEKKSAGTRNPTLSQYLGLSAIKIPFSGSARFKSCISEILAYTSSSGALKSVISMMFDMVIFSCSVFLFSSCYCNRISLQKKARCYMFHLALLLLVKQFVIFRSSLPSTGSYPQSLRLYNTHSGSHEKVRRRSSSACLLILLL